MNKVILITVAGVSYFIITGLLLFLFFQDDINFRWHYYFSWGTFVVTYLLSPFLDKAVIGLFIVFIINCFWELVFMISL